MNLEFLKDPNEANIYREMEVNSKNLLEQENCVLPDIRSFQHEDLALVAQARVNLPHWKLSGSTYFVTFCVKNRENKPLLHPTSAKIVEDALKFYDTKQYHLDAYVIMPDHVHLLIKPFEGFRLKKVITNIKKFTANEINKLYQTKGRFWQIEPFDHLVRNLGYWVRYFDYIHNNPVKAKLASKPEDYLWSSLNKWYMD